jgi:hypothetical protein
MPPTFTPRVDVAFSGRLRRCAPFAHDRPHALRCTHGPPPGTCAVCCAFALLCLGVRAGVRASERERDSFRLSAVACMAAMHGRAPARTGVSPAHGRSYPAYERLAHWTVAMRTHGSNPGPGSWDRSSHERQAGAHGTADGGTQVPPPLRRLPIIMN